MITLAVGTYNIQTWNEIYPYSWSLRRSRVAAVLRKYAFDVIGLQEAKDGPMDYLCADGTYAHIGVARQDPVEEYGSEYSSIFYRKDMFKVLDDDTFWLSETPEVVGSKSWNSSLARVCTYGHFLHIQSGQEFYYFNTHLDHISWDARREGLKLIVERMKPAIASGKPCFLTGDLNTTPERPELKVLDGVMNDARFISETTPTGPETTFNAFDLSNPSRFLRIDYIYTTPGIKVKTYHVCDDLVDGQLPADHYPVVAKVEF